MSRLDAEASADIRGFDAYEVKLGDHLRGERATRGKSLLDVQRELRVRASYIAAIENCDLAVFPNLGFVAGYVRSYARYLKLNPEEVFERFCRESGFGGVNAGLQARKAPSGGQIVSSGPLRVRDDDPLLRPVQRPAAELQPGLFERLSVSAVGSILVLVLLLGGLGFGGYTVLQNIQRVTLEPVNQTPRTVDTMEGFSAPGFDTEVIALSGPAEPSRDADLIRIYEPTEMIVPIVDSRDGPIVDIDPATSGLYAAAPAAAPLPVDPALELAALKAEQGPQVREDVGVPQVNVVARQPAWVRIYLANGTVLFEKILDPGETYTLPLDVEAPLLRAGNSGSVYLLVNDAAYGPLGNATSVAKDVSLLPDDIRSEYALVTEVPDVIQATVAAMRVGPSEQ
ncbi:helix-turn-helix domain-containing protein [Oceanibium sediminis]|uniref:helix-turn-helix domain-containing protein n=1 Tax=Oceanibium sediminis TaxID=2026339 RepID=UPI000DD39141|nr:helix-turn-helix domain-containing protein [Oceanibium sediminis]